MTCQAWQRNIEFCGFFSKKIDNFLIIEQAFLIVVLQMTQNLKIFTISIKSHSTFFPKKLFFNYFHHLLFFQLFKFE